VTVAVIMCSIIFCAIYSLCMSCECIVIVCCMIVWVIYSLCMSCECYFDYVLYDIVAKYSLLLLFFRQCFITESPENV
jgi:hypothetical protein